MTLPKITLAAKTTPNEGAIGSYTVALDTAAPAGGLTVYYNTAGSTAMFNSDYNFTAGPGLNAVTANSFTVAAGAKTATLNLVAYADTVTDPNETVVVNLTAGTGYDLTNATLQFAPHTGFIAGSGAQSVTVADFNNDGNADLATANYWDNTVSILSGNGNGGIVSNTAFAVGIAPYSVTVADFNGDGNADLATANGSGNNVSVRLGNGNGGFAAQTGFAVGLGPTDITVADFNGDGNADLAVANFSSDNVSVRLGNGSGGFVGNANFAVGFSPYSVTVADFNGDGNADLATANFNSNNVSVLLGNGNGGFAVRTDFAVGFGPESIATADFNGDGNADLVTANYDGDNVSVRLGNGNGGFTASTNFAMGFGPLSVTAADFNGDGNVDLATANNLSNNVSVRLGNGNGGFADRIDFAVKAAPYSVTAADLNNDGKVDLATDNVSVLLNTARPTVNTTATLIITDVSNNHPTGSVVISDTTPTQDQTLTVSNTLNDLDGLGVITYSWLADGSTVGKGNNYTVTASEVGKTIAVTASYTDDLGNAESVSSDSTSVVTIPANHPATGTVSISDTTPQQGQTLTVSSKLSDLDGLGTISYTWKTGETSLSRGDSYTVTADEIGKSLSVTASYIDNLGYSESVSSDSTAVVIAANHPATGTVSINDTTPQQGQTLTATHTLSDLDGLGTISYTWKTGETSLSRGDSYTVTADEIGKSLSVTASYIDNLGYSESVSSDSTAVVIAANHPATGTVSINDTTPQQGQTLTATHTLDDVDGLGTISYAWKTGTTLLGSGNSYTVTSVEVGKTLSVTASYTDGLGNAESISSTVTSAVVSAPAAKPGVTFQLQSSDSNTSEGNALVDSTAGTVVQYDVTLNTAPVANHSVTINFSSNDLTEGTVTPSLTFNSSNWDQPQVLSISGVDDLLNDGNVSYTVSATIDGNKTDALEYLTITVPTLSLQNIDDVEDVPINDGTSGNIGTNGVDYMQGNNGNDQLYGGYGYDELKGGLGNDELYGEQGNDRLYGQIGNDTLYGGYQDDKLYGDEGDDTLWGEEGIDSLDGGVGNDTLDGGTGLDTLVGGEGNDTYYLGYDAVDVITDNGLKTDVDTVIMPYQLSKYTLPSGIENGTIADGTQASSLSGNGSDNTLTGNAGKNKLIGAVGRDSLFGGLGDDALNGGTGDDVLAGGTGKDNLTGGAGKDMFLFETAPKASVDKITDFKPVDDSIELENKIFTKLTATGLLNAGNFVTATASVDSNDYLVYNKTTGELFYDADGNGAGVAVQIAVLGVNLALTSADFIVI